MALGSGSASSSKLSIKASGFNVEIIRSYNSHNGDVFSGFGYGWTFNYNHFLEDTGGYVYWHDGDGSVHEFIHIGDGEYTAPSGIHARLNKYAGSGYTLYFKNGMQYDFNTDGILQFMIDKNAHLNLIKKNL